MGFVTRFIWMCRCRFVVNRQTKKRIEKIQFLATRSVSVYTFISMVCSTNPKWYWRLICKLRYLDYLIKVFMLRVKHTPCAIKHSEEKHFQMINYEQNWILRNLKPCAMSDAQWTRIKYDVNVSMENDKPLSKLFNTNKLLN